MTGIGTILNVIGDFLTAYNFSDDWDINYNDCNWHLLTAYSLFRWQDRHYIDCKWNLLIACNFSDDWDRNYIDCKLNISWQPTTYRVTGIGTIFTVNGYLLTAYNLSGDWDRNYIDWKWISEWYLTGMMPVTSYIQVTWYTKLGVLMKTNKFLHVLSF